MSEALGTTLVFVLVFIVVPWGLILTLRLVGRRRGYGDLHRWRTMRTPTDAYRYQRCLDCGRTRDIPAVGPPP